MQALAVSGGGVIVILIAVAIVVIVVVGLGRMAWGIVRGDRELESGGSMGHQMTAPLDDDSDR